MNGKVLLKRVTAVLLTLALVFSLFPNSQSIVYATEETISEEIETEESKEEADTEEETKVTEIETEAVTETETETEIETETETEIETETATEQGIELLAENESDDNLEGMLYYREGDSLLIIDCRHFEEDSIKDCVNKVFLELNMNKFAEIDIIVPHDYDNESQNMVIEADVYSGLIDRLYSNVDYDEYIEYCFFNDDGYGYSWRFENPKAVEDDITVSAYVALPEKGRATITTSPTKELISYADNVSVIFTIPYSIEYGITKYENDITRYKTLYGDDFGENYDKRYENVIYSGDSEINNAKVFWWCRINFEDLLKYKLQLDNVQDINKGSYTIGSKYRGEVKNDGQSLNLEQWRIEDTYGEFNADVVKEILSYYSEGEFQNIGIQASYSDKRYIDIDIFNALIPYLQSGNYPDIDYNFGSDSQYDVNWNFRNPKQIEGDGKIQADAILTATSASVKAKIISDISKLNNMADSVSMNFYTNEDKSGNNIASLNTFFSAGPNTDLRYSLLNNNKVVLNVDSSWNNEDNGYWYSIYNVQKLTSNTEYTVLKDYIGTTDVWIDDYNGSESRSLYIDDSQIKGGLTKTTFNNIIKYYDKYTFNYINFDIHGKSATISKDVYNTAVDYLNSKIDYRSIDYNFYSTPEGYDTWWSFSNPIKNKMTKDTTITLMADDQNVKFSLKSGTAKNKAEFAESIYGSFNNINADSSIGSKLIKNFGELSQFSGKTIAMYDGDTVFNNAWSNWHSDDENVGYYYLNFGSINNITLNKEYSLGVYIYKGNVYDNIEESNTEHILEIDQWEMESQYGQFDVDSVNNILKNYDGNSFDVIRINAISELVDEENKIFNSQIDTDIYNAVIPYLKDDYNNVRIDYNFSYRDTAKKGCFICWTFNKPVVYEATGIINAEATIKVGDDVVVNFTTDTDKLKKMAESVSVNFWTSKDTEGSISDSLIGKFGNTENELLLRTSDNKLVVGSTANWWAASEGDQCSVNVQDVQNLASGTAYKLDEYKYTGYSWKDDNGLKYLEIYNDSSIPNYVEDILSNYDEKSFNVIYLYDVYNENNNTIDKDLYNVLTKYLVSDSETRRIEYTFILWDLNGDIYQGWYFNNPTENMSSNIDVNAALKIKDGWPYIELSGAHYLNDLADSVDVSLYRTRNTDVYECLTEVFGVTNDIDISAGEYGKLLGMYDANDNSADVLYTAYPYYDDGNLYSLIAEDVARLTDGEFRIQEPTPYTLTVTGGKVVTPTSGEYRRGTKVTIKVDDSAIPQNKQFKKWTTNDVKLSSTTSTIIEFTMPDNNVEIKATYEKQPEELSFKWANDENLVYTGKAITPDVKVTCNGEPLKEGADYTLKYSNNVNASTKKNATVTVTGIGTYSFVKTLEFEILPKSLTLDEADKNPVTAGSIVITSGSKATPTLVYNGQKLGTNDYTITVNKNHKFTIDDSENTITVEGKGNYEGERNIKVTVIDKSQKNQMKKIGNVKISLGEGVKNYTYNGKDQKPESVTVYDSIDKTKELKENTDYTVSYSSNIKDAGKVSVTVVGIGDYTGTVTKTYTISPLAVKDGKLDYTGVKSDAYEYNSAGVILGDELKVIYKTSDDEPQLKEGTDYKVTYSNNKKVGTAKFTITFMGNYKGSKNLQGQFKIEKANLASKDLDVQVVAADKIYSKPNVYKSTPYVTVNGVTLKSTEYTVEYYTDKACEDEMGKKIGKTKNNISLRNTETSKTVYVKITAKDKGNYLGTVIGSYNVVRKDNDDIEVSKLRITVVDEKGNKLTNCSYTGYELTPKVKIEVKNGKNYEEISEENFDIQYINNINKGNATILINAIPGSGYIGSKTVTFSIVVNKK